MKRLLSVLVLTAATSVGANELKFGDLNYFLKQGQMNAGADISFLREAIGSGADKNMSESVYVDAKFAFGVIDNLNVAVSLAYDVDTEVDRANGANFQVNGLKNPYFAANYRVLNQASAAFNLDLGAIVKYNLMDVEVGDSEDEGTIVAPYISSRNQPSNSAEFNARLGNKWNEANEYYFLGGVIYNMATDYDDVSGGATTEIERDSSLDFKLGAFYQYRPVNEFMMTVGLVGTKYSDVDENSGAADYEIEGRTDYDFTFVAKYLVDTNMIVKFNFAQGINSEYDYAATEIKNRREGMWGLGVDYLF